MTRQDAAQLILPRAARIPADPVRAVPSAASGDARVDPTLRPARPASGRHTLHIDHTSSGYRIIHTRPDTTRQVYRRGLPTFEDARLRALWAETWLGYEVVE